MIGEQWVEGASAAVNTPPHPIQVACPELVAVKSANWTSQERHPVKSRLQRWATDLGPWDSASAAGESAWSLEISGGGGAGTYHKDRETFSGGTDRQHTEHLQRQRFSPPHIHHQLNITCS